MTAAQASAICAEISRLELKPGDVLIVRPKEGEWSRQACEGLRDRLAASLPAAVSYRFLIVNEPMDLDIVAARPNA
jgi:hypothetical protein